MSMEAYAEAPVGAWNGHAGIELCEANGYDAAAPATGPIIVVDAEPMVRKSLASAIRRSGAEVVTASDGEEALAKLRELHSALIFADLRLPRMDGLALLRAVKRVSPTTAVVLITGFTTPELTSQALRDGAAHVLVKPFAFAEVQRIVNERGHAGPADDQRPVMLTQSPRMETLLSLARRVAQTEATVLVQGETGTGKEMLARFIHEASARAHGPFVAINCCALPESLVESELFGHERGAFTGAIGRRAGRFEVAAGGTLVLDEVSEIPLGVQAKLLRALQEREIHRVGSSHPVKVNVRVIGISNRDLRREVQAGRFRQDLFYRLNVVNLNLPPLRERAADIPLLSRHFLQRYAAAYGSSAETFTPEAMARLLAHSWPGNIRELENAVQGAVILSGGREIDADRLALDEDQLLTPSGAGTSVVEMEKDLILATLKRLGGNRTHAAKALGVSVRTIRNRLREYRLTSPGAVL
jgi:DNA-binding NtrC family response regulator